MKKSFVLSLLFFLLVHLSLDAMTLSIFSDADSNGISFGEKTWTARDTASLFKILGRPDRREIHRYKLREEEYAYGDIPASSREREVSVIYFVYDSLGLLFATKTSLYYQDQIYKMYVFCEHERSFDNIVPPPFKPHKIFTGQLILNNNVVNTQASFLPRDITYKTSEFPFYGITVGPASILTNIDRLYSIKSSLYFLFYLDNATDQRLSYMEIVVSGQ